jgi:methionyl-tRNA formyltransferase
MGRQVRIVFLTADDPIYLPEFFTRVLGEYANQTQAVYVVPPLYTDQTPLQAGWRYFRTFGSAGVAALATRLAAAKLRRQSIAATCALHEVPSAPAADVNATTFVGRLRKLDPDVVVSVSCPQIFRRPLIDVPSHGMLNVHGALLPHYRGVMPSFWMLANDERLAGVSIHFVDEQIDAGAICGQRSFEVRPRETLDGLLRRSKAVAADLLIDVLRSMERGTLESSPLDPRTGSYYSWPDRAAVQRFRQLGHRLR